ncbi:LOG family protein [Amaricoccus macauensis]|uniref:LOG family protein n=1 Tax=Amaricoccus macauensis TaxID=57001 RepID=UPI003C7B863B
MTDLSRHQSRFPDAREDLDRMRQVPRTSQTESPSYRLAFNDTDFIARDELRPVRLQLELLKAELALSERGVVSTIAMLGSARIPDPGGAEPGHAGLAALGSYYDQARAFARLSSERALASGNREDVVCTGGGPGIMEAGNRGAEDAGGISISLNIVLPHEQAPNPYCTPDLAFNFHYFAIRKMHFLMRARAIAVFPGGFGTFDELFEVLTLVQTRRMAPLPILLFGKPFWEKVINWNALADAGTINSGDIGLFHYVETPEEAWEFIDNWKATG